MMSRWSHCAPVCVGHWRLGVVPRGLQLDLGQGRAPCQRQHHQCPAFDWSQGLHSRRPDVLDDGGRGAACAPWCRGGQCVVQVRAVAERGRAGHGVGVGLGCTEGRYDSGGRRCGSGSPCSVFQGLGGGIVVLTGGCCVPDAASYTPASSGTLWLQLYDPVAPFQMYSENVVLQVNTGAVLGALTSLTTCSTDSPGARALCTVAANTSLVISVSADVVTPSSTDVFGEQTDGQLSGRRAYNLSWELAGVVLWGHVGCREHGGGAGSLVVVHVGYL